MLLLLAPSSPCRARTDGRTSLCLPCPAPSIDHQSMHKLCRCKHRPSQPPSQSARSRLQGTWLCFRYPGCPLCQSTIISLKVLVSSSLSLPPNPQHSRDETVCADPDVSLSPARKSRLGVSSGYMPPLDSFLLLDIMSWTLRAPSFHPSHRLTKPKANERHAI